MEHKGLLCGILIFFLLFAGFLALALMMDRKTGTHVWNSEQIACFNFLEKHMPMYEDYVAGKTPDSVTMVEFQYTSSLPGGQFMLLKSLPNLEELNCHYGGVDDSFSDCLPHLPKLKKLILFATDVTGKSIPNIAKLPELEYLRIARKPGKADSPDEYFSDHSLELLADGCPKLEHLFIGTPCNITDDGLRQIAKWKHLRELSICSDHISPDGIDYLRTLSHIPEITIYCTNPGSSPPHTITTGTQRILYTPPPGTVYPPVKEETP